MDHHVPAQSGRFYRVDRFTLPGAGRDELLGRLRQTGAVLRAQPGFVRDYLLERADSAGAVVFLTFVEWDDTAQPEAVKAAVQTMHRQASFDPHEMYDRLGIEVDMGTYRLAEVTRGERDASGGAVTATTTPPPLSTRATGTYENDPADELPFDDAAGDVTLKRATVRRRFTGDITGESVGHVTICRPAADRLGYVATDRFAGTVAGRRGGFAFQHGGPIDRGALRPFGYIVPGSGTGELAGVTGDVEITFTPPATHTLTLTYAFER